MVDKNYKETDTHIYFWNSYLSNFASCNNLLSFSPNFMIESYRGNHFKLANYVTRGWFYTSEQAYMVFKALYFEDFESVDLMMATDLPREAKNLGRQVKGYDEKLWEEVRFFYMEKACHLKFSLNEDLKEALVSTGDKTLVEASPYDLVWGVGLGENDPLILDEANWKGLNLLGLVLMNVRGRLRK
jgi:ribA/ribD-fused uncharacterized protein